MGAVKADYFQAGGASAVEAHGFARGCARQRKTEATGKSKTRRAYERRAHHHRGCGRAGFTR